MTPQEMAELHTAAFAPERGWSVAEFSDLLASPHVFCVTRPGGFALVRAVADEAELLTLVVSRQTRRQGIADALMAEWMALAPAKTAFLEVAADNHAARALYARHGFAETGRRCSYYKRPDRSAVDAVLMQAALTPGQRGIIPPCSLKTG